MIVLVIRSRKVFYKSRPGKNLFIATLSVIAAVLVLPFTPLAGLFGFSPLPVLSLVGIVLIVLVYIVTTEAVKKVFYKKVKL
jgi:Mg2+-importing ATPase